MHSGFRYLASVLLLSFNAGVTYAEVVMPEQFGMHLHGFARGSAWPSVNFGFIRLWDTGTNWNHIEPYKGQWNFKDLDRYVETAHEKKVKILMTLGQTPQWAALNPAAESPYSPGASSPPKDILDWRNYVRTLAERYKGKITHWEVWNEVDVKHFYSGDMKTLVVLERAAAEVLKSVDPANVVLTPSVQSGAFGKLDAFFSAGGGRVSDVISYHFYVPKDDPEEVPRFVKSVRNIMAKHGLQNKPLWNTESGWLIANRDGGFGRNQRPAWITWRKLDGINAADMVLRAYLVNLGMGVSHLFWYAWDNGAMGLAEDMGKRVKPAVKGYETAYRWLVGSDFRGCSRIDDVHYCLTVLDGVAHHIVWAQDKELLDIPKDWLVSNFEDIDGRVFPVTSKTLRVGTSPIRLSP